MEASDRGSRAQDSTNTVLRSVHIDVSVHATICYQCMSFVFDCAKRYSVLIIAAVFGSCINTEIEN